MCESKNVFSTRYDISPKLALKVQSTLQKCVKPESKFLPAHKIGDKSFKGLPVSTLKIPEEIRQERISLKRKNAAKFIDFTQPLKLVAGGEPKAKKAKLETIQEEGCVGDETRMVEKFVASEISMV